jgi:o-succinylbenzoate synthase
MMRVEAVELRVLRMPLVRPFATSQGVTREREVLLARALGDSEGWGEGGDRDTAIAMATLDAELKAAGVSLAQHLGGTQSVVDATATVGFDDDADEFLAAGYRSLKFKVAPDRLLDRRELERGSGVSIQVDANGSFAACPERVDELDDLDLLAIEQPLAAGDVAGHAELVRRLRTAICLDESITSAAAVDPTACRAVCVKYFRLGGVAGAKAVHDRCAALGLAAKVGGMLETGIGRAAAVALAALPGFTMPADLSASDRYWSEDVTEPFVLDAEGRLRVPQGPGLGVEIRMDVIERHTVSVELLRLD